MPVNTPHPLYEQTIKAWQKCRDAYVGQDAIKAAGKKYLPQPSGLDQDEYEAYTQRALFYESVGRTIDGFVGAVARKDPTIEAPESLNELLEKATADGLTIGELIKQLSAEAILQGRLGLLVDMDDKSQRSYLVPYAVETIINWDDEQVVLHETVYERDAQDRFKMNAIEQYRQLSLDDGAYTCTIWRKPKDNLSSTVAEWVVYSTVVPTKRGKPLDAIPFFWLTPLGKTTRVEKPPLLGLVNVCLAHYMNSADLEWGRHFTGLPTLYVCGHVRSEKLNVGSTAAILIEDAQGQVGYAEFNGQGLQSLENALTEKEAKMAVLGASVFVAEKKGVEAADTARIRTSGETNLLTGVVTAVEETICAALICAAEWMGINEKIEVTMSRDFVDTTIDGPTLTGLVQAYQAGALTIEQFLYNLQQGEMLIPDTDIDEEAKAVGVAQQAKNDAAVKMALATKPPPGASA